MSMRMAMPACRAAALAALAGLLQLAGGASASPASADAVGIWEHPENGSQIETYRCGAGLCAKIVRIADGQTSDHRNPDPARRGRPIVGLVIVGGAAQAGPDSWAGSIYNRIDGRTYEGRLTIKGRERLELTGCTAVAVCRTVTWRRVP